MREIKFRAIREYDSKWIYGFFVNGCVVPTAHFELDGHHLTSYSDDPVFVKEETIGQLTGLRDKNGVEIYEGDILSIFDYYNNSWTRKGGEVIFSWEYVGGWVMTNGKKNLNLGKRPQETKIIGNIHDNPELLEVCDVD